MSKHITDCTYQQFVESSWNTNTSSIPCIWRINEAPVSHTAEDVVMNTACHSVNSIEKSAMTCYHTRLVPAIRTVSHFEHWDPSTLRFLSEIWNVIGVLWDRITMLCGWGFSGVRCRHARFIQQQRLLFHPSREAMPRCAYIGDPYQLPPNARMNRSSTSMCTNILPFMDLWHRNVHFWYMGSINTKWNILFQKCQIQYRSALRELDWIPDVPLFLASNNNARYIPVRLKT